MIRCEYCGGEGQFLEDDGWHWCPKCNGSGHDEVYAQECRDEAREAEISAIDSVKWSVESGGGSINNNGLYTPTSAGSKTVKIEVEVSGDGTDAKSGTSSTCEDTATFTVTAAPPPPTVKPDAKITSLSISNAASIKENEDLQLSYSIKGTYDFTRSTSWSASSGSISNSGLYTPADITQNTTVTVELSVTVEGNGTNAKDDTQDTETDSVSFDVIAVG